MAQIKVTDSIKYFDSVKEIPIDDVSLNDWNPNFVPNDIREAIQDDIKQNGFLGSIIVQKYNKRMKKKNVIINGEHRFKVLKEMGGLMVPATVVDVSDEMAQILTIRLNREHGELLPNRVGDVLNMIAKGKKNSMEFLTKMTFLREKDIEALMNLRSGDVSDITQNKAVAFNVKVKQVKCPACGNKFEV